MQRKPLLWFLTSLLCLAGAIFFWKLGDKWQAEKAARDAAAHSQAKTNAPAARPQAKVSPAVQARLAYRLSNTDKSLNQLARDDKAIILANALIDTEKPLSDLKIPAHLRAPKNNGTYLVQSRGPADANFRALLADAGATIISYIPNNAFLVRVSEEGAQKLSNETQSVLPYEPYYKLDQTLLKFAVDEKELPGNIPLNVVVFPDARQTTLDALRQLGADVVGEDRSPFGPVLTVHPAKDTLVQITALPGVQGVAAAHVRKSANDLTRVRLGVSVDTVTNGSYLGLSGSNVLINVNDSGADVNNPDFANGRVTVFGGSTTDPNGHGTHVLGTILGNGSQSATVTPPASGSVTNAIYSGMATNATAFVIPVAMETRFLADSGNPGSDSFIQQLAALTNALISNNSWNYGGDAGYDIAAASYDAAVRDALPEVTGSQPLVIVFSAGNGGGGGDDGGGGDADTIFSPGTAKNVITVGALEQLRNITNNVVNLDGTTNQPFVASTDSSNQVASFSSRGNVGIGIEGQFGRFKPDLIAPGTFVVSDKSTQWDQASYFNPTNFTVNTFFNQVVGTDSNSLLALSVFLPQNAVGLTIQIFTNNLSQNPFPAAMPIYIGLNDNPTTNSGGFDFLATNFFSLPTNSVVPESTVFFSVLNPTNQPLNFDIQTVVITTNDDGNLLTVLSNLDNSLGAYRYESGTSMSVASVSGMLALMQEFFQSRLQITNVSPALLKALLINGARPVSGQYDFEVQSSINLQGWGLPSLPNSIPAALTNLTTPNQPLQFFDQNPTNALATGESKTRRLTFTASGAAQDLRVTLVWTDPPGNPAAGIKLVNDLDLIVTNLDTGDVFYGNDIPSGSDFNETATTNGPPPDDFINNVENVYLPGNQGTNFSVTVFARHVNVNAVTANTNNIVQDYALVISSGDAGAVSNAFTLTDVAPLTNNVPTVTVISNGVPLLNQRVGANPQYAPTTNGIADQWHFYVFTNTAAATNANFTNVAFVTFLPPNLGLPRGGTLNEVAPPDTNATRVAGADIDLYVSGNPGLTNLNPIVIANAFKSLTRTGTEMVLFTNSTANQVYYVGVKSEDQEGAEFGFVAVATDQPFGQKDPNGNIILTVISPPLPAAIPPGSPALPGVVSVLALTTETAQARKVVVTDSITHQEFGDLIGTFSHNQKFAVLDNHSFFDTGTGTETFTYDDSGEKDPLFPGSRHSDGPGSLQSFIGDPASGVWILSMVNDSSLSDTGTINSLRAIIEPQNQTNGVATTIPADSFFFDFVDVPPGATNLTINVVPTGGSVELFVRRGALPTLTEFDKSELISPPGTNMMITEFDSPPLNPGRYFIGIFNPNAVPIAVNVFWTIGISPLGAQPLNFVSGTNVPILDDAITYSPIHVANDSRVVSTEVGVRIDHPRESDLVLTLISPSGTRVLLAENRGGLDTNGFGSGINTTNVLPQTSSGGIAGNTNVITTPTNAGTLIINYDFFTVPDDLRVYYDGNRIFDTGLISGSSTISVDFGPGASDNVSIVMNEAGSNPFGTNGDAWTYTVTEISKGVTYAIFSENTNLAQIPIKFAVPPFGSPAATTPPVTNIVSDFEGWPAGDYAAPLVVDGWTVLDTNPVKVVTVSALANDGTNVLALHHGSISRVLPTVAGDTYTLTFASHGHPVDSPVSWWKAEGNAADSADGNVGTLFNGATFALGEVGQAFSFNGTNAHVRVPDAPNLHFTNAMSVETWIFPTAGGVDRGIVSKWDAVSGFNQRSYALSLRNTDVAYFDISPDGNFGPLEGLVLSANTIPLNQWTYLAATYDGAFMRIYVNGVLEVTLAFNSGIFPGVNDFGIGGTVGGVAPGGLISPFPGLIDEATVYSNALSLLQIQDIYAAGSAGKNGGIAAARMTLGSSTNLAIVGSDFWKTNSFTFTASSNGTVLAIQPFNATSDGMLFDSFQLVQQPAANPTNYFQPEEPLTKLVGEKSQGDWQLEIWDNRVGATNPQPMLDSWQLSLVLEATGPAAIPLSHAIPNTNSVQSGFISYYTVDVPPWAQFATNILITASGPVNLLFNQNALPGTNATDVTLLANTTAGIATLSGASVPPLVPGQRYYLGVQNNGVSPVNFTIEVDFDITTLTNGVPRTNDVLAATAIPRYYQYDVSTNATAVAFELFNLNGNVDLVARRGPPLPDETSFDYISANPGTSNETILVSSNSAPVVLTPGRWYLGVFNNDVNPVTYTIEAIEGGQPIIIPLTNGVAFTTNVPPGPDLNLFFEFDITNSPTAALFELYNLNGNVDLDLQSNSLPFAPPFFASSTNPGTNREEIVIRTNTPDLGGSVNGTWFLGVPNNDTSNVTFTIRAVVATNGMLISGVPINTGVTAPGPGSTNGPTLTWPTVPGEMYEVQETPTLFPTAWVTIVTITATGPTTIFTIPTPVTGIPAQFYRIVQIPVP